MKAWRIALLSVAVWLSACGGGGSVGEGPVAGTAAVGAAAPGASAAADGQAGPQATDVRDAQGNPLVGTTPSGVTFSMPLWRTVCARLTFFSTVLQREICDTVAGVSATPQVTLRVSRFGQGEVVVDRGALACRQQDCDGIYPAGTRVAVTATAAPGWTFDHWTGCDAASGATCDVTLADNRTVQPFFVSSTTPRIKAGVVVLDAQALDQLVSVEDNVLTFRNASAQLSAVAVGNILVSGRGDGFARRVLNIIALNGGNILFATAPAALTDIVEQGTVVGGAAPASGSRAVPLSLERGVTVAATRRAQDAAATTLNIDVSLDDKVRVSGSVALEWNPEVALDFGPVSGLQEFKLLLNPKVTPALTVSWTGLEIDGDKAEKIFDLGVFKLSPILIQAGPVPIVIVPTVKGFVRFSAAAGVKVDFLSSLSVQGSYGVHYVKGAGWSGIHSTIGSGSFSPSGTGEVQGQLGVGSVATFFVYDRIGPFLRVGPYLNARGAFETGAPSGLCRRFNVDLGIKANTGGEFQVFAWNGRADFDIVDKVLLNLYKSETPACSALDAPEPPTALTVAADPDRLRMNLQWQAPERPETVIRYEIFRDGVRVGSRTTPGYVDGDILASTTYCYQVRSVGVTGRLSIASNNACAASGSGIAPAPAAPSGLQAVASSTRSIALSWTASAGRPAAAAYVVYSNGQPVASATGTQVNLLRLQTATRYCYVVRAYDVNGELSEASAEACATTLPETLVAWTMYLGCQQREYLITRGIDLNLDDRGQLDVTDSAIDYNGTPLAYHLTGTYDAASTSLSAQINWTFTGSTSVRRDTFTANLASGDTGNVAMTQVLRTGCEAQIRLVRRQ